MKDKVLVIGYGSIGKRHTEVLKSLNYEVLIVSRRNFEEKNFYKTTAEALQSNNVKYIVIANETSKHQFTLDELNKLGYKGVILIEKPLTINENIKLSNKNNIFVGYNLRFHPIIKELKAILREEKVLSVNCYVGQYLPTWRLNTDYRKCYSASSRMGGGVLKDLSHELDYLSYLFGDWGKLVSLGGKISDLEIDSNDEISVLFTTNRVSSINLELNYLDHIIQRYIIINTNTKTIRADLIKNTLQINNDIKFFDVERNYTYSQQHLAILKNESIGHPCTLNEGYNCDAMIQAIEQSLKESKWIYNEKNMYDMC